MTEILSQFSSTSLYGILFLGSFGDALIGINFFIHGEIFFLSGAHLAQAGYLNLSLTYAVLVCGALLGDNISYFLGSKLQISYHPTAKIFTPKRRQQVQKLFNKHGNKAIFFSKLLGPVAWITPFFAGSLNYKYRLFWGYNLLGTLVGIGQFIILGYFGSLVLSTYIYSGLLYILFFFLVFFLYKQIRKILPISLKWYYKILKVLAIITVSYLVCLSLLYFVFYPHTFPTEPPKLPIYNSWEQALEKFDTKYVYGDKIFKNYEQPINIFLVTSTPPKNIFHKIRWEKGLLFSHDNISLPAFIKRIFQKKLPISDFFLNQKLQDYAFQNNENSLTSRNHIRLWKIATLNNGKEVYAGSISRDNGWKISMAQLAPTIVHDIEIEIDKTREKFKQEILKAYPNIEFKYLPISSNTIHQKNTTSKEYVSDGQALLLSFP